jgi:hypothetical protein
MIGIIVRQGFPIMPFMICLAVIIIGVAFAIGIALVWDKEPWFRKIPKPSRVYKNAKDQVKIWKLQQKYPKAFPNGEIMKEEVEDVK